MQQQIITTLDKSDLELLIENAVRRVLDALPKKKTVQQENDYLTIEQASAYTHIAKATLYDYTHRKKIPYRKVGKKLLFSKAELKEWIETHRSRTIEEIDQLAQQHLKNK